MKDRILPLVASLALALVVATPAAAEQQRVSAKVGVQMTAAQDALKKKQWDVALKKLGEAEAVAGKTAYDQFQINELTAYAYYQQKKFGQAAALYEKGLNSGQLPADKVNERLVLLASLNQQSGNPRKAVEYYDRLLKSGGASLDTQVQIANAHYKMGDYKAALPIMQGAIKSAEQAGKPVPSDWLQLVFDSQQKLNQKDAAAATMQKMVLLYPTPANWDYLLSTRIDSANSDRVQLNLLRLKRQVGLLRKPADYLEMAEILLVSNLPAEAEGVMQSGFDAKVFDGADKTRADQAKRRLSEAKAKAAKARVALPALEAKATAPGATGQADVDLGLAYASLDDNAKAIDALTRGLKKGGVKDPQQAQIALGIASLKAGKKAEAVKVFKDVKDTDKAMVDVAQLWVLAAQSRAS
jgi:tetratricopeptide (TPR) repeat protein